MSPEQWDRTHVSPLRFATCDHHNHRVRAFQAICRDCGHTWREYPIHLSDDEYDTLLAYVAFRLDSK